MNISSDRLAVSRSASLGRETAPRRLKSSSSGTRFLDDIGEGEVLVPSKPRRHKSVDELDAALLWDGMEVLSLHEQQELDELSSSSSGDTDDDDDMNYLESDLMDECSLTGSSTQHSSRTRPRNIMQADSFASFASYGSNMTAVQEQHPGRFVTPMNSFTPQDNITTVPCNNAPPERITIDPSRLLTADISFRLPLVRSWSKKSPQPVDENKNNNSSSSMLCTAPPPPPPPEQPVVARQTISILLQNHHHQDNYHAADDDDDGEQRLPTSLLPNMPSLAPPPPPGLGRLKRKTSICRGGS